jgi:endonuclease YncB( thermonuclease family)
MRLLGRRSRGQAVLALLAAAALVGCDLEPLAASRARAGAAAPAARVDQSSPAAHGLAATVTRVADGDSLVVSLADGRPSEVRLHGIDAPELDQAFGREAREHLRRLTLGERVELQLHGVDPYGRHLAVAHLAVATRDEGDLGLLQIRAGQAWHNVRYAAEQPASRRELYAAAEREARRARAGLWSAASPLAPWDFKAADRRGGGESAAPRAPGGRAAPIVGNRRSGLYHLPGCPGHSATSPRNAVPFESEEAARQAGYRRAPNS